MWLCIRTLPSEVHAIRCSAICFTQEFLVIFGEVENVGEVIDGGRGQRFSSPLTLQPRKSRLCLWFARTFLLGHETGAANGLASTTPPLTKRTMLDVAGLQQRNHSRHERDVAFLTNDFVQRLILRQSCRSCVSGFSGSREKTTRPTSVCSKISDRR